MASRSWLLCSGGSSARGLRSRKISQILCILSKPQGGLFARSEALRDVAVANALPIVCGGQGESDLNHAGAKGFIDLALPRGRVFGADRQKELAPFASLIKQKQIKLFYPAALCTFRSDAARQKAPRSAVPCYFTISFFAFTCTIFGSKSFAFLALI